jgi:hypothetical protein
VKLVESRKAVPAACVDGGARRDFASVWRARQSSRRPQRGLEYSAKQGDWTLGWCWGDFCITPDHWSLNLGKRGGERREGEERRGSRCETRKVTYISVASLDSLRASVLNVIGDIHP